MINAAVPLAQRDPDELLTLLEVASILKTPPSTVRDWRHRSIGPKFFRLGRHVFTTVAELRAWIQACRSEPSKSSDPQALV